MSPSGYSQVRDMSDNIDPRLTPATPPSICPNCATTITGPFCARCGQAQKNINRPIWAMIAELFDDLFQLDSRLSRTLYALVFKPGRITVEYLAGRRAGYIPPVRLYLVISFLFFVILPFLGLSHTSNEAEDASLAEEEPIVEITIAEGPLVGKTIVENQSSEQVEAEEAESAGDSTSTINLGFLTPEENEALMRTLKEQFRKAIALYEDDPEEASSRLLELISIMMFFLLPVFAGCLKIFYLGKNRYYAKHLLLVVHNHCFLYIGLSVQDLLNLTRGSGYTLIADFSNFIIYLWLAIYFYMSLKRVYQEGHLGTTIKFILLSLSYMTLALFGILAAMLVGIMSL